MTSAVTLTESLARILADGTLTFCSKIMTSPCQSIFGGRRGQEVALAHGVWAVRVQILLASIYFWRTSQIYLEKIISENSNIAEG